GYYFQLQDEYTYLKRKFNLDNYVVERPKYFRLRPDNFPTIRLSQLANLYFNQPHLFSSITNTYKRKDLMKIFQTETSLFWKTHYYFGKPHPLRNKALSEDFVDLIIINTVVPIKFSWMEMTGIGDSAVLINLLNEVRAEKNSIVNKFNILRPGTSLTALQSQALLHLKSEYCDKNFCMKCQLGAGLLKSKG